MILEDFKCKNLGKLTKEEKKEYLEFFISKIVLSTNELSDFKSVVIRGRHGNLPIVFLNLKEYFILDKKLKKNLVNLLQTSYCLFFNCQNKYFDLSLCSYKNWRNLDKQKKLGNECLNQNIENSEVYPTNLLLKVNELIAKKITN